MVEFKIEKIKNPNFEQYPKDDLDIAYKFAKKIYKELGAFLKSIVLFGSSVKKKNPKKRDIDIMLIVDDVSTKLNPEMVEAYRIITEKIIVETSNKLHVTTLKLTSFWEYVRMGDPVAVNILRDGAPLMDTNLFEPLQRLLMQGKIRPSPEAVWTYFHRAPNTLLTARWHLTQATLDLYWAVIDAAHAALMKLGEIPPSPSHVSDLLEEKMVKKKLISKKYADIMQNFYKLAKMITYREIKEISGEEFERYYKDAKDFVDHMRKFVEKKE